MMPAHWSLDGNYRVDRATAAGDDEPWPNGTPMPCALAGYLNMDDLTPGNEGELPGNWDVTLLETRSGRYRDGWPYITARIWANDPDDVEYEWHEWVTITRYWALDT